MADKTTLKAETRALILTGQGKVRAARHLALSAFEGLSDRAGEAYAGHLLRVMAGLTLDGTTDRFNLVATGRWESLRMIALLHDLIEDIPGWTYDDLADIGFDTFEVDGVRALTKIKGEPYFDAMVRLGRTPVYIPCKRSDLRDNCNIFRFTAMPQAKDFERLAKYFLADKYLESIELGRTPPGTAFGVWMAGAAPDLQDWTLFDKFSAETRPFIPAPSPPHPAG